VEIKIGVHSTPRELVADVAMTAEELVTQVEAALRGPEGTLLQLTDVKGRRLIVVPTHLAYVEIGEPESRRVGFGAL
jgi:hypothetical protein